MAGCGSGLRPSPIFLNPRPLGCCSNLRDACEMFGMLAKLAGCGSGLRPSPFFKPPDLWDDVLTFGILVKCSGCLVCLRTARSKMCDQDSDPAKSRDTIRIPLQHFKKIHFVSGRCTMGRKPFNLKGRGDPGSSAQSPFPVQFKMKGDPGSSAQSPLLSLMFGAKAVVSDTGSRL